MLGVTEHELQGVAAERQFDARLALPGTEMNVILVGRNDRARLDRLFAIDEQMVVTGVGRTAGIGKGA